MMRAIVVAALLLVGCKNAAASEAEAQEQAYTMAGQAGDLARQCAAARAATNAWLKAGNQEKYRAWSGRAASTTCRYF